MVAMRSAIKLISGLLMTTALALAAPDARAQCVTDRDCKAGRICTDGSCSASACSKDTDCAGDQLCQAGSCVAAPTSTKPYPKPAADAEPTAVNPVSPAPGRTAKKGIKGLVIAGPIILGVTWLATIGITAGVSTGTESERIGTNVGYAAIPIAGPFVLLADGDRDTDNFAAPLILAGVLQTAGLAMTIVGVVVTRDVDVPAHALGEGMRTRRKLSLRPSPIGAHGAGISLRLDSF
jgi:hypothetical protein